MDTKKIVEKLRCFAEYRLCYSEFSVVKVAADRLEELENKNAKLKAENDARKLFCEAKDEINKDLYRSLISMEQKLSEKQPEWISVEDERKPKHLHNYFVAYVFGVCDEHFFGEAMYIADKGNGIVDGAHFNNEGVDGMRVTHWMEIPQLPEPPKPKKPTFKDVFLKAFPGAVVLPKSGAPVVCAKQVFPQLGDDESTCDMCCAECWNQPYFAEGEGEEGEADA